MPRPKNKIPVYPIKVYISEDNEAKLRLICHNPTTNMPYKDHRSMSNFINGLLTEHFAKRDKNAPIQQ